MVITNKADSDSHHRPFYWIIMLSGFIYDSNINKDD